jgi:glycosyltransferase involved in cell wall biosynthesis
LNKIPANSPAIADGTAQHGMASSERVAVLIPCYNEACTIAQVVRDARRILPHAQVVVGDNNCTDDTATLARSSGATVLTEIRQGKGYMVRRLLREIDADWYVLLDGDSTYDLTRAPAMLDAAREGRVDFVNGVRVADRTESFPTGHAWGNRMLTQAVVILFGDGVRDMLSGYKVLSRRFAKSFPSLSTGFDLETDLAVHALECGLAIRCMDAPYRQRPVGSFSKLSTLKDGFHIGRVILALVRHERPMVFFGVIALALSLLSIVFGVPVLAAYLRTGLVARFPTAILSMGFMFAAMGSVFSGIMGDAITRGRREVRMLAVLSQPSVVHSAESRTVGMDLTARPVRSLGVAAAGER